MPRCFCCENLSSSLGSPPVASDMAGASPGCRLGGSWWEQGLAPGLGVRGASRQVTTTGTEAAAQGCLTGDKIGAGNGK